jgi:Fe-S cluster assembly protein SufB
MATGPKAPVISIAVAAKGQYQDAGARMIHQGKDTSSTIISKSIVHGGGVANYRGTVRHEASAENAKSHVECDTLILDEASRSDTIPTNEIRNNRPPLSNMKRPFQRSTKTSSSI